jgi:hypothetical protein
MVLEKVTLFGLTIVPGRRIPYGPIDPAMSRHLMIEQGLVGGHIEPLAFPDIPEYGAFVEGKHQDDVRALGYPSELQLSDEEICLLLAGNVDVHFAVDRMWGDQ